jgi:hypothetical protein
MKNTAALLSCLFGSSYRGRKVYLTCISVISGLLDADIRLETFYLPLARDDSGSGATAFQPDRLRNDRQEAPESSIAVKSSVPTATPLL